MNTLKDYIKQFEANIQELDLEYVRALRDACDDEIARKERLCEEEGRCPDCGAFMVIDTMCDEETGFNTVSDRYCPKCGF